MTSPAFFPGFEPIAIDCAGVRFAGVVGGDGPPLLLLHGYPETHIAWRHVAPALAARHRVVIPDLPGYGASRAVEDGRRWTKRRMGTAVHALMASLGHDRFSVVGHDRGARVGYRMALDQPDAVRSFASLAVVPTIDAMAAIDYRSAATRFHWFFLSQPAGALHIWRRWADDVSGAGLRGGHLLPEEEPDAVLKSLVYFLG